MKKRSLILITVDCLRADHVGFHGYHQNTTAFLDSLARESFVLRKAIVAGAPTYFSFPAIMASRYPLAFSRDVLGIAPGEATLARALAKAGYVNGAFIAANPYLSARFGYHQGFSTFQDFPAGRANAQKESSRRGHLSRLNSLLSRASRRRRATSELYDELYFRYCQWRSSQEPRSMDQLRRYPAADVVVDNARSWLCSVRDQPFFLWLHLMDPHHPYYPPEKALAELGCGNLEARRARFVNSFWSRGDASVRKLRRYTCEILSLYDASIYWVDRQIARLVDALKHLHRWDDTVLAVTGDHGEEFLENGRRYHTPHALPDHLIHVPLLIRVPGVAAISQADAPFSLMDLSPTLLEILDQERPPTFKGRSRWQEMRAGSLENRAVITECIADCNNPLALQDRLKPRLLAVRNSSHKLVINFKENTEHLFELATDPGEKRPLGENCCRAQRAALLQVAREHLKRVRNEVDQDLRLRSRIRELRVVHQIHSSCPTRVLHETAVAL